MYEYVYLDVQNKGHPVTLLHYSSALKIHECERSGMVGRYNKNWCAELSILWAVGG